MAYLVLSWLSIQKADTLDDTLPRLQRTQKQSRNVNSTDLK